MDADEVVGRRRGVGGVLGVVDVADAGAGRAGVAVAGAVARQEALAEAGVVEGDQRRGVAVGLAGGAVGGGAGAVVLVDAVAELVERHAGDLAGVGAAAARLEEVERRAVPVGVAGLVQVDVDGELRVDPGVGRQPAADHFLDPVDLVELLARGVGVARAAVARRRAVGARRGAEGEVAGAVRALRDRAAGVGDLDVLAGERRGDGAAAEGVEPGRVGEAAGGEVGEGHRPHDLGAGRRRVQVDAAGRLRVLVDVGELEHLAAGGVDARQPGPHHAVAMEDELPDLDQAAAVADLVAFGEPVARDRGRQEVEAAGIAERVPRLEAGDVGGDDGQRLLLGQPGRAAPWRRGWGGSPSRTGSGCRC